MLNQRKTEIERVAKEDGVVHALFTVVEKKGPIFDTTNTTVNRFVGSFSKHEWRKIKTDKLLNTAINFSPWFSCVMTVVCWVLVFPAIYYSILYNSIVLTVVGLVLLLLGTTLPFVVIIDFLAVAFHAPMLRAVLRLFGHTSKTPENAVVVKDFVKIDEELFMNHMKKIDERVFVNFVKSFVEWAETEKAYYELNDAMGASYKNDDPKLYDFLYEKKTTLFAKVRENEAAAKTFARSLNKDEQDVRLVKTLQKTDRILVA